MIARGDKDFEQSSPLEKIVQEMQKLFPGGGLALIETVKDQENPLLRRGDTIEYEFA